MPEFQWYHIKGKIKNTRLPIQKYVHNRKKIGHNEITTHLKNRREMKLQKAGLEIWTIFARVIAIQKASNLYLLMDTLNS